MYKNPIHINQCEMNHFGDPFVLRFNGKYYLYPSTKGGDSGVYCYVSDDLINFKFAGKVFDDDISECAYAPEVVYYNGEFILCTSPRGNGHYLYKAKSPLGPFVRFTDNIKNMIDGSFYIDKNNILYFLRANHYGISILEMDKEGNTYNRNDLNCHMGAWTEGPGLFYFDDRYYLTYTGNNVCSTGYRINYSTSKFINHDYKQGVNNPILISTDGLITRFGHSSNALGPDLDSMYAIYHELRIDKNGHHLPRRFLVNRFDFNGSLACVNSSTFLTESPKKANFQGYGINDNFIKKDDGYFYKDTFDKFTFEGTIKNGYQFIFNYINNENYFVLDVSTKIVLKKIVNGNEEILLEENNNFDLNYLRTYRIIADQNALEVLIDGALIFRTKVDLKPSQIGLKLIDNENLEFNAITKEAFNSSRKNYSYVIPGMLMLKKENYVKLDPIDEVNVGVLEEKREVTYKTIGEKGTYFISINASLKQKVKIEINGRLVELNPSSCEFAFYDYALGKFSLNKKDELNIKLIEGEIEYKYLKVNLINSHPSTKKISKARKLKKDSYELNRFDSLVKEISFELKINKHNLYQKAGCLFQASNLSDDVAQARYPITSLFVGIEGNLLVLDYFNYGSKRIYDVPVLLNEENKINLKIDGNNIKVYLNGQLKINTNVPILTGFGRYGFYRSIDSDLQLMNLQVKE